MKLQWRKRSMAAKDNRTVWNIKHSLIFLFSFFPFLQWITCFVINGRIPKKRWLVMGLANIGITLLIILVPLLISGYINSHLPVVPSYPSLSQYLDTTGMTYSEYSLTPEYQQYQQDCDAYRLLPDVIERTRLTDIRNSITTFVPTLHLISWFIFMVLLFFIERYRYLRELWNQENRNAVYQAFGTPQTAYGMMYQGSGAPGITPGFVQGTSQSASQESNLRMAPEFIQKTSQSAVQPQTTLQQSAVQPRTQVQTQAASFQAVNINTADESTLMTLPGMMTIQAKKILAYRTQNGPFPSREVFFRVMEAKPHIIVRLQDKITLEDAAPAFESDAPEKRRFDL